MSESYREGMQIGNALMGFGRTMSSIQKQGFQQEKMGWEREDRARGEQSEEYLGFIVNGDKEGLDKAIATHKEAGTLSHIAILKAQAAQAEHESNDLALERQKLQNVTVKSAVAREKSKRFLQAVSVKGPDEVMPEELHRLGKMVADDPRTGLHVDFQKDGDPVIENGNLVFTMRDTEGHSRKYSKPWGQAIQEGLALHGDTMDKEAILASAYRAKDSRLFNIKAMSTPEIFTNSKGGTAARITLRDRRGQPVIYTIDDESGDILTFSGNYEDTSDNFKQILPPEMVANLPKTLGKDWKSTTEMTSRAKAKDMREAMDVAGKPTLTEEKSRVDMATKQFKTALSTFKTKEDSVYKEDGSLNEDATSMNAFQHALEAYKNPKSEEEYTRAARVMELFTQAVGRKKPPGGQLFPDTKITQDWIDETFSKKTDAEQETIFSNATPGQRGQIKSLLAKSAKPKGGKANETGKEKKPLAQKGETAKSTAKTKNKEAEGKAIVRKLKKLDKAGKARVNSLCKEIKKQHTKWTDEQVLAEGLERYEKASARKKMIEGVPEKIAKVSKRLAKEFVEELKFKPYQTPGKKAEKDIVDAFVDKYTE